MLNTTTAVMAGHGRSQRGHHVVTQSLQWLLTPDSILLPPLSSTLTSVGD